MAVVNGKEMSFQGISFAQIAKGIVASAPCGDVEEITVVLEDWEEDGFRGMYGFDVGKHLFRLICVAIREKDKDLNTDGFTYVYFNRGFRIIKP